MESRLLNGFHDDHFKYEIESPYWPERNDTVNLQLTETLNGILPPEEVNEHCFENDASFVFSENSYINQNNISVENMKNLENAYSIIDSNLLLGDSSITEVEVISVDPNYEDDEEEDENDSDVVSINNDYFVTDSYKTQENETLTEDDTDSESDDHYLVGELIDPRDYENGSIASEKNFNNRNRTDSIDSSSIGDYDDYEEDDECQSSNDGHESSYSDVEIGENAKNTRLENFGANLDNVISVKDLNSTIFSTQNMPLESVVVKEEEKLINCYNNTMNVDDEDDIDVDVETVQEINASEFSAATMTVAIEQNQNESKKSKKLRLNDFQIEDDISKDPSWTPTSSVTTTTKPTRKVKTQDDIKKITTRKIKADIKNVPVQKIRGRPPIKQRQQQSQKSLLKTLKISTPAVTVTKPVAPMILERRNYGIGRGGKNISMCKPSSPEKEENETVVEISKSSEINQPQEKQLTKVNIDTIPANIQQDKSTLPASQETVELHPLPTKRKLNLEEYKKRRGVSTAGGDVINIANVINNNENVTAVACQTISQKQLLIKSHEPKMAEEVPAPSSIPNQLLPPLSANTNNNCNIQTPSLINTAAVTPAKKIILEKLEKTPVDPITEAKNKVLRWKEMKKKAALDRIIDSTVSAKVGPITKILPLEEIVKNCNENTDKQNFKIPKKLNVDEYEEIIIVSMGVNTDLSIPPILDKKSLKELIDQKCGKKASLFYNISDTLEKANSLENNVKIISSSSLLSSIQDTALKKLNTTATSSLQNITVNQKKNDSKSKNIIFTAEHGEDKIIMHLRKDRVRLSKQSIGIQTLILPQFPPLQRLLTQEQKDARRKQRSYRSRRRSSTGLSSYDSDSSYRKDYNINDSNKRSSSSENNRGRRSRSRKRQYSRSTSSSYSSSSSSSRSRSSSLSSQSSYGSSDRYHRSKYRRRHYHNRDASPAVEERRIVYVGRIEQETTKEDLRRKFSTYGPIRQITIHYKDTGMKYGFVTFEKAQDAFQAIDNGMKDKSINMYDISFGGRRAFCRASYADLDGVATNILQQFYYPPPILNQTPKEDDSFEALLAKMKQKLCNNKKSTTESDTNTPDERDKM